MFNPRTFENSRPDGFPVLEIADGCDREHPAGRPVRLFAPLRVSELSGTITGPVAALTLRQRFRFSTSQVSKPIEAIYRFPLPGDAAVTGVTVAFGTVRIATHLAERGNAEQSYQDAIDEGRQALLVTRESPDVFTLHLAGIRPDEDVEIETAYVQLAKSESESWSLRVPLTTAPRYVRQDERGSAHANGQPLAVLRDPGHRFVLNMVVEGARTIDSPTHEIEIAELNGRASVRLHGGEILPDRDFVLRWRPLHDARKPVLQVLRHDDAARGDTHVLALVVPPSLSSDTACVPCELILLIDHSGSMSGPKWEAADWAVQNLLASLSEGDTFNLGLFHSTTRWFSRKPVRGDERTVRQAREFLLQHRDSGGTELGVALEQALQQARDDAGRARHVVIVTDAQVSDAGRILTLVDLEAARHDRRRVDVLCIDAAPNSGLANEVSERGGGVARFLTSDPGEDDIASALDDILGGLGCAGVAKCHAPGRPSWRSSGRSASVGRSERLLLD
jgi:Ca-activated chloride channel family protein